MGHSGGIHGDAGGAVEKRVAVHVFDDRAFAARDDERIVAGIRGRDERGVLLDDRFRFGAWEWRLDVGGLHCFLRSRGAPKPPHAGASRLFVRTVTTSASLSSPAPCLPR